MADGSTLAVYVPSCASSHYFTDLSPTLTKCFELPKHDHKNVHHVLVSTSRYCRETNGIRWQWMFCRYIQWEHFVDTFISKKFFMLIKTLHVLSLFQLHILSYVTLFTVANYYIQYRLCKYSRLYTVGYMETRSAWNTVEPKGSLA